MACTTRSSRVLQLLSLMLPPGARVARRSEDADLMLTVRDGVRLVVRVVAWPAR
jgi:hypothetical protein